MFLPKFIKYYKIFVIWVIKIKFRQFWIIKTIQLIKILSGLNNIINRAKNNFKFFKNLKKYSYNQ